LLLFLEKEKYPAISQWKKKEKKLKKVSSKLELPILLNTKPSLQQMAEFITTGQHDKAELERRKIKQSSSRLLEATQTTSQQADSGSDQVTKAKMLSRCKETNKCNEQIVGQV
jgi:hypothetical protein